MSKKSNRIIAIGIILFTLIAIFVLFADAFAEFDKDAPSVYGNVFNVMFGKKKANGDVLYNAVPLLIVAFVLYCVSLVTSILGAALNSKAGALIFGITGIALVACGILFLLTPKLFIAANPSVKATLKISAGPIVTSIFAFIGGLLGIYGAYQNLKA